MIKQLINQSFLQKLQTMKDKMAVGSSPRYEWNIPSILAPLPFYLYLSNYVDIFSPNPNTQQISLTFHQKQDLKV